MPADKNTHALARLLARAADWRRTARRRRARLHGFMQMSDRMLADIGVRRADLHAAISGVLPVEHIARTRGGAPWTAHVHALRPHCPACVANDDLSAAA